ncbi:MAG: hypothetical protein ACI31G_04705 [Bacilli bacterium]
MKFKKLVSLFGVLLLTGCRAENPITLETTHEAYNAIEETVSDENYENPDKVIVTGNYNVKSNEDDDEVISETTQKFTYKFDHENSFYYFEVTFIEDAEDGSQKDENVIKEWLYKTDNEMVNAVEYITNGESTYKGVCTISLDGSETYTSEWINLAYLSKYTDFHSIVLETLLTLKLVIGYAQDAEDEGVTVGDIITSGNGLDDYGPLTTESSLSFFGDTEGNLKSKLSVSSTGGITQDDVTISLSFKENVEIEFKNYLPIYFNGENDLRLDATKGSQNLAFAYQHFDQEVKFSYKSFALDYPDLTDFVEVEPVTVTE